MNRPTVESVATLSVPDPLPPAIVRPRQHVEAVLAQSLTEVGENGRAALAWQWVLNGTRPSPVTLSLASGRLPAREEISAEADADPEGSTAPPGVPTDFCDQLGEVRRILRWLIGESDEIPVDCENRSRFIGARGDYARTDKEIRQFRDRVQRGLDESGHAAAMDSANAGNPCCRDSVRVNATWLRGVRDLLDWVLGDRSASPLHGRVLPEPPLYELDLEEEGAEDITQQSRLGGSAVSSDSYPPPQYGEGIQAAIRWLRGETTATPIRPYSTSSEDASLDSIMPEL